MRPALVLIALFVTACGETIVLGTECPLRSGPCARDQIPSGEGGDTGGPKDPENGDDGGGEQPGPGLDGGSDRPSTRDAGPRDAGAFDRDANLMQGNDAFVPEDAGPALFPPFRNPSFELVDGGVAGPIAEIIPSAPSGPTETAIAPWVAYACGTGITVNTSVTYGIGNPTTIEPSEGNTFVTNTFGFVAFNLTGVTQELTQPLLPGRHYGFAVDVYAQRDVAEFSPVVVEVTPGELACVPGRKLGTSAGVLPEGWKTVCVNFTTPESGPLQPPIRRLMLLVTPTDPVSLAAVHIDNIHPDPACHNEVR